MAINIASGDDRVPLQVGRIGGRAEGPDAERDESPAGEETTSRDGRRVVNVCGDDAQVGIQTDVVIGDVVINMPRRA